MPIKYVHTITNMHIPNSDLASAIFLKIQLLVELIYCL